MRAFRVPGRLGSEMANSTPATLGIISSTTLSLSDLNRLTPSPPGPIGKTTQSAMPKKPRPANVEALVELVLPAAQRVKADLDVPIAICIAQAALETGWGKTVIGNAYFGIKGKPPSGASTTFTTTEYTDPKTRITLKDTFRAYKDLDEAADDYGRLLKTDLRYAICFNYSNDSLKFADALQTAGYATDPNYSFKLKSIILKYELYMLDGPKELLFAKGK
jgi:flagellar protein FlgJ